MYRWWALLNALFVIVCLVCLDKPLWEVAALNFALMVFNLLSAILEAVKENK